MGVMGYDDLARALGRSREAIKLYRCRHRMPRFNENFYSYTLLSSELGKSRTSLRKYYRRGWLIGQLASWSSVYGKRPMVFVERNIISFLRKFYHLFDWRRIPNLYFKGVVKEAHVAVNFTNT